MSTNKPLIIAGISILSVIVVIFLLVPAFSASAPDRSQYQSYDLIHDPLLAAFRRDYADARASRAAWLADPVMVALRVAGYPNNDGTEPDSVTTFSNDFTTVTIVIRKEGLHDDSVAAEETRVDLVKRGMVWEVAWAGGRWRCGREVSIGYGWTTALCP